MREMSRTDKTFNLIAVVVPFAAIFIAIATLWNQAVSFRDLAILAVLYIPIGFGVTIGFHRLLTHRAFATSKPMQYIFAILGTASVQGPVIAWVADHRKHHAHTDEEGDPHSPHVGHGEGLRGVLGGLWHAHTGWLFNEHGRADWKKYAPDLMEDRGMKLINRFFPVIALASLAIPFAAGYAIGGTLTAALTALLWGGLVRVFLLHHVTWSINSICHFSGSRRFDIEDRSTNVFWLALPSLGESWHHNHHAFPRSAVHGLKPTEIDISSLVIGGMERVGLAWNVVRIAPERQQQKLVGAAPASPAREAVATPS
jgi:stearoyl-CoA desaturase (delta-9 desaturase)